LGPSHSFLDVCAAPGGKTFQAIETRGNSRGIVASDRHLHRLRTLRGLAESRLPSATQPESIANAANASATSPESIANAANASAVSQIAGAVRQIDCAALDAQLGLPFRRSFDRILVDAPCSGTGTLARNPEIKWRLIPEDIADLAAKQQAILGNALDLLAPGGLLVYATCSLEPEENQGVIDAVRKGRPNFELGAYFQRIPGREPGDGFFARQIRRSPGG
jgi:16S rRNA (cytosine967-C5)-methyltransferase